MKKKAKYGILSLVLIFTMTGCTTYLKNSEGKAVTNPTTGQNLTENILCRPTDEETIKLYEDNGYDLSSIPYCVCDDSVKNKSQTVKKEEVTDNNEAKEDKKEETKKEEVKEENKEDAEETKEVTESDSCEEFGIFKGKYEGLWTSIFVKPLAYVIIFFGKITGKFGLGLIITSLLIRLILFPLTKKSTLQTEKMKNIQPELNRLEKKYANKDQNDREVMMAKSQEMMMIYKKNGISPMSGCLPALLQLPLLMAFLDAINRTPAIFEENFLGFHLGTTPRIGIGNGNWLYIILTVLVAVTTFYSIAKAQNSSTGNEDMAKQTKMMMNMMTIMIIVMSIFMSSALNMYWIISNGFTLIQNYLVKRSMK